MNHLTKEPCKKCGLIQLKDILWGLQICGAKESQLFGCPPREYIDKKYPDWNYDEEIYKNTVEMPNFMDL